MNIDLYDFMSELYNYNSDTYAEVLKFMSSDPDHEYDEAVEGCKNNIDDPSEWKTVAQLIDEGKVDILTLIQMRNALKDTA